MTAKHESWPMADLALDLIRELPRQVIQFKLTPVRPDSHRINWWPVWVKFNGFTAANDSTVGS